MDYKLTNEQKQQYIELEKQYREQLAKRKTIKDKIEYLENCEFNIQMVDRWTTKEEMCIDIVWKLEKEINNGTKRK